MYVCVCGWGGGDQVYIYIFLSDIFTISLSGIYCLYSIQNFIKISHRAEDLRRFPYFHIFTPALSRSIKSGIWQFFRVYLVNINVCTTFLPK